MNSRTDSVGGTARRAHLVNALPWLWLGMSAAWAVVIFITDQLAWPLALWIATTVGPLTAVKTRLDSQVGPQGAEHAPTSARGPTNETMSTPTRAPGQIDQAADEREEAARRYVRQLRVFYVHAAVFAASMAVILAVNLLVNLSAGIARELSAWWSLWALVGWGAGIAVHGLVVRLNRPSFSSATWEQRQIDRMLE